MTSGTAFQVYQASREAPRLWSFNAPPCDRDTKCWGAFGSRPADREVARARTYERRLLSTAFSVSAMPQIATTERTCQHVSNVP